MVKKVNYKGWFKRSLTPEDMLKCLTTRILCHSFSFSVFSMFAAYDAANHKRLIRVVFNEDER